MTAATPAVRVGCDVVDVRRLATKLQRTPGLRDRLFTATELADVTRGGVAPDSAVALDRLAARFAAKEAARKALGDLRLGFHQTEIRSSPNGAPHLYVHGRRSDLAVSLSHDGGVAMAVVAGVHSATPHLVADSGDLCATRGRAWTVQVAQLFVGLVVRTAQVRPPQPPRPARPGLAQPRPTLRTRHLGDHRAAG